MKIKTHKALALLLCFCLCLALAPAALAADGELRREYGDGVIVGFEELGPDGSLELNHKYALVELEKRFPSQLDVRVGGAAFYGADGSLVRTEGDTVRRVDVVWNCLENYDEDLELFHFIPAAEGYELAEGLEPPTLTAAVHEEFVVPAEGFFPAEEEEALPILGAITASGRPLLRGTLPTYYNAYKEGLLPPIRNQNTDSTCWAFAAIGSMEADLIHDGAAGTDIDLSELHIAYFAYHNFYDEKNCNKGDSATSSGKAFLKQGGDILFAYRNLANMVGMATEADVPYSWAEDYAPDPDKARAYTAPQITGAYYLSPDDRDGIKNAILQHGGVSAAMHFDESAYSATYNSYYSLSTSPGHAIMFVGWDDDFPRENFASDEKPSENGAWLVRNSWGVNTYDKFGYFWMSYCDMSYRAYHLTVFDAENLRYDHCYGFDAAPLPGYPCSNSELTVSQNFQVDAGERIEAVGIETNSDRLDVALSVTCGDETVTAFAETGYKGFYLIPLPEPLTVARRSPVTIEITLTARSGDGVGSLCLESVGNFYYGALTLHAESASGGIVINGELIQRDGRIKLYTVNDEREPDCILPEDLTEIGAEAFSGGAFTYVRLSENTVSIGENAFANCPNLALIYIPQATTEIDENAFGDLQELTVLGYYDSLARTYAEDHGFGFRMLG